VADELPEVPHRRTSSLPRSCCAPPSLDEQDEGEEGSSASETLGEEGDAAAGVGLQRWAAAPTYRRR
jgi:hypothetical protein